jgi:hypothetical protein
MIMTRRCAQLLSAAAGPGWTGAAQAQEVPPVVIYLAMSPLVVLILSILLGVVTRRWRWTLASLALGAVWISWFLLASSYTESDTLVWAPVFGMWAQSVALLAWILGSLVLRLRTPRDDT